MQRCSNCNSQQLDGTIFCSDCGATLIKSANRHETTAALSKAPTGNLSTVEELSPLPVNTGLPAAPTISLVVINSGRRINLDAADDLLVGRKDNQRGIYPDVDLGLDGGYDAGVSRRHAIIAAHASGFTLQDLSSANGTFVNGRRLPPETPTPVRHGDEIKFGTLILRFEVG